MKWTLIKALNEADVHFLSSLKESDQFFCFGRRKKAETLKSSLLILLMKTELCPKT